MPDPSDPAPGHPVDNLPMLTRGHDTASVAVIGDRRSPKARITHACGNRNASLR